MPPEPPAVGSPHEWLRYARSDLAIAEQTPAGDVLPETLCFHAQQATEKAIKAVLVHHVVAFPYTHSVEMLITIAQGAGIPWPSELGEAALLTDYAVTARYPALLADIGDADRERAVALARSVLEWATGAVAGH